MIDYIAWLLEEDTQEETPSPLLTQQALRPLRPLRPARPQGGEDEADWEPAAARLPLQGGTEAAARAAEAAEALQSARRQPSPFEEMPAPGEAFEAAALRAAAGRAAEAFSSAREQGARPQAAAAFYERIREARRSAEAARLGGRRAFVSEAAAGAPPDLLDLAALDRCFERDARRYDSGAE